MPPMNDPNIQLRTPEDGRNGVQVSTEGENGTGIAEAFVEGSLAKLAAKKEFLTDRKRLKRELTDNSGKSPGWNSDPQFEAEKFVNDAFIKDIKEKIRRMENAIEVFKKRQSIVAENGEVSKRKFGDIVWGYKIEFPDVDESLIQEELNIILVPSALLVGKEGFKMDINGEQTEFTVISPSSEIGKRIVESSL